MSAIALAERLQRNGIDSTVISTLKNNASLVMAKLPIILDDFYNEFVAQPEAGAFFRDKRHMAHAREMQLKHWSIIIEASFDESYAASAKKIGHAHKRFGLEPMIYIAGYSFVLTHLLHAVARSKNQLADSTGGDITNLQIALTKATLLDMEIAISTYFGIERHDRERALLVQTDFAKHHDALTGLPNRTGIAFDMAGRDIAQGVVAEGWTVFVIDLDRFHQINNKLGTTAGDAILKDVANSLKAQIRLNDVVARLSGDVFALIMPRVDSEQSLVDLASRILLALEKSISYQGTEVRLGASVGIASSNSEGDDQEAVLSRAEVALNYAKTGGRGTISIYSEKMQGEVDRLSRLSDDIARGIEHGEFLAYYQPKFRIEDLRIIGVEVLLRWQHHARGLLFPDSFLAAADSLNWTKTLDEIALAQAERNYKRWAKLGIAPSSVSINIPMARLAERDFLDRLGRTTLPKSVLTIELLESAFMDDVSGDVAKGLLFLRDHGIGLEVDDFGTGHSSILGLIRLMPSCAKIDRRFVPPASAPLAQYRVIKAMIAIAKSLGMKVTVEGVEELAQIDKLRRLGCDIIQGFALGKPVPAEELEKMLAHQCAHCGMGS